MEHEPGAPTAYAMAYFSGQDRFDGEQVRLAVSADADPSRWEWRADGAPILTSQVGEAGARDPFLLRDRRRGVFVVIATDLRTAEDDDWDRAVRRGSRDIVVWESHDLQHWSDAALLRVAPEGAGNAWAPKAVWIEREQTWWIVFASALYAPDDSREQKQHQRLFAVRTDDFRTVSEPWVYSDPGHDVIDATFIETPTGVHRFSANTHGDDPRTGHHVFQERAERLDSDAWQPVVVDIGKHDMAKAEGPAVFASLTDDSTYLLLDDIDDRGYHLFRTTDLAAGDWVEVPAHLPPGARHGSVLPISGPEAAALRTVLRQEVPVA